MTFSGYKALKEKFGLGVRKESIRYSADDYTNGTLRKMGHDMYRPECYYNLLLCDGIERARTLQTSCICSGVHETKKVALHNMCDITRPCGFADYAGRGFEEQLAYRSNLFQWLHEDYYPLHGVDTIYSPSVTILPEDKYDNPAEIAVISCPALQNPQISDDKRTFYLYSDYCATMAKLETIFAVAVKNGIDILVLSAWGCGAFHNPIPAMADIFSRVIKRYDGYFYQIDICINNPQTYQLWNKSFHFPLWVAKSTFIQQVDEGDSGDMENWGGGVLDQFKE